MFTAILMRTTGNDRAGYGRVFVEVKEPVAAAPVEEELAVRVRLQQHTPPLHSQKPNATEGEGGGGEPPPPLPEARRKSGKAGGGFTVA